MVQRLTRRTFSALGLAAIFWRSTARAAKDDPALGISRTAEAIHQEVTFKAAPARVYQAIVDEAQFSQLTGVAAQIGREVGSAFSLFGGQIKGRHLELTPAGRIVQAWRSEGWPPHVYSIVRFELTAHGAGTKLVFDHTGFPVGQAEHLASGWKGHYWESLEKLSPG